MLTYVAISETVAGIGGSEMKKWAYYNEHDKFAAAWIRELMKAGHIMEGEVDERSIEDVLPIDVAGFIRCHWFAGIAGWDYALRQAGWADDRHVWTGSCPCQPFSSAGEGLGFADERHLWPAFHHLIKECRPPVVFGEQVASKAVDAWIDLVHSDLEAVGYAFGSVPFPSASVGAPHIRDRNFWCGERLEYPKHEHERPTRRFSEGFRNTAGASEISRLGNNNKGSQGHRGFIELDDAQGWEDASRHGSKASIFGELEHTNLSCEYERTSGGKQQICVIGSESVQGSELCSQINGFWRDADWLGCRDGKWRPVEPGTFPLAHGASARMGRLRGYGNAINAEAAKVFIESYLEIGETNVQS